MILFLPGAI